MNVNSVHLSVCRLQLRWREAHDKKKNPFTMPSLQRYRVDPDAEKKKKKKKMRPLRSRGRIMIALVCLAFMFVFSFGTGTEYLSGFTEQTLCQCNCPSEGPPAAENNNNNNNCSSSFFSSIFINNPLKSSSKDTTLVTLESEKYFMKNNLDLNFRTQVQVWQDVGKICVNITLAAANENDEAATCPYPYFRARLSGVAIVDIPLQRESKSGCALFPVAGRYHLDVALLHCTMNAWPTTVSSSVLRTLCPVLPKPRENAETYHLNVLPFERNENVVSEVWPQRNPFSRRAFVYSPPPCPDGQQQDCNSNNNNDQSVPPIVRFDSQDPNDGSHNNEPKSLRFRDYSYVEVDPYKGAVVNNSKAVHFASNDTVCFVGDDHAQVLAHQTKLLYTNQENVDQPGCDGDQHVTEDGQFRFFFLKFARDSLNDSRFSNTELFGDCNLVLIHQGNFDAVRSNSSSKRLQRFVCVCFSVLLIVSASQITGSKKQPTYGTRGLCFLDQGFGGKDAGHYRG